MGAPYGHLYNGFRTYRDWLAAIPERYRDRPAYITETDQNDAWLDEPNNWVQSAYAEIDAWNQMSDKQKIRTLILYRWPPFDKYAIQGKRHVIEDFKTAQRHGYKWTNDQPEPPGDETMMNPSFELPYTDYLGTVKVAHGWLPFWSTGDPPQETSQGPCVMPEYKQLPRAIDASRIVDGDTAQCWFLRYKVMDAGVLQKVDAVPGRRYKFDVSLQAWCSNGHDPSVSEGEMYATLGIAANGNMDPWDVGIQWTTWARIDETHRRMESREVVAEGGKIVLFIRAWNKWKLEHNDVYADDAHLVEVGSEPEPPGPQPPGECRALTEQQIRAIVREELDGTKLTGA